MAALTLVKEVENAKLYQDGKDGPLLVLLENVRLSFPAIGHMKEDKDEETGNVRKAYKGVPMLPKATHVEAKNLVVEVMNKLMKDNEVKIPPEYRCIKNGDDTDREEYQGHWVISCSESRRPAARDRKGQLYLDPKKITDGDEVEAVLDKIDEIFHGGVYVNILIRLWYFNGTTKKSTKKYPKRICAGLTGIQFFKDEEPGRRGDEQADEGQRGQDPSRVSLHQKRRRHGPRGISRSLGDLLLGIASSSSSRP